MPAAARKRFKRTLKRQSESLQRFSALRVRLCFGKTDNLAAFFPLTAFLEQFHALETLQNVAFRGDGAGSS